MTPDKQISPVIRISRGERDASARATHLGAATRKFLVTTNERKQMSTKTNFKRIALVAIASLGLSLFSSVPSSQAAIIGVPVVTATNGTATIQKSDSTTAATVAVKFNANQTTDSVTLHVSIGEMPSTATHDSRSIFVGQVDTLTTTGANVKSTVSTAAPNVATAAAFTSDTYLATANGTTKGPVEVEAAGTGQQAVKFRYYLDTAVARVVGTYTFDYYTTVYSNGSEVAASAVFGQFTIVVTNSSTAAAGSVAAAGTSSALLYEGSTWASTEVDSSVSVIATPSGTAVAAIRVTLKTAAGLAARESLTVTSTVGNIGSACSTAGKSLTIIGNADGINDLLICGDGNSGVSTITIKSTSVTFSNKQVTFYGSTIAKITATALVTTIGASATNAILAVPTDSQGNVVRSSDAVYAYSDAVSVINTGTAPAGTSCGSYNSDYEGFLCSLSGSNNGTANITIRNASTSSAATVASTAVALKVNTAAAASFTLAFNKATYAPGEKAYIIVKPLDAAKGAIGGTTMTNLLAAGGISSTMAFGSGSDTLTAVTFTTGGTLASQGVASSEAIKLYTVYMPASGGTMTISATGGSLLPLAGQVKVSATATVTDSGASALAAVNALATTVASLKTLITTLTNLVLKIQKKVKA